MPLLIGPSLEDVGTRQEHLTDLLDMWNGALGFLMEKGWRTDEEDVMVDTLTTITEFLKRTMTKMSGPYNEAFYKTLVNTLPRDPKEITE